MCTTSTWRWSGVRVAEWPIFLCVTGHLPCGGERVSRGGLMSSRAVQKLAERWIAAQLAYDRTAKRNPPAVDAVINLAWDLPKDRSDFLWRFILEVTKQSDDPDILEMLGASPLEDLIRAHGVQYFDRIDSEAAANPGFKTALGNVWVTEDEDPRYVDLGCKLIRVKS